MNIFGYTIELYKTETPESIRANKINNFKLNATKGLIDAELQLQLNQASLELAEDDAERERLQESVTFQEKSIKNYKTQLAVLNNQ